MSTSSWRIDPAHTSVELSVKHMMFTRVRGRLTDVEGNVEIDDTAFDRSRVSVRIAAASIDTGVRDRDAHLRAPDFLDVERYPDITFESKRVEGTLDRDGGAFRVVGDLTIRGVSREVTLDATYHGRGEDPWGHERVGFEARTEIDRRDWGLTWNQTLEKGGILVGNVLNIELGVQAVLASADQEGDAEGTSAAA